VRERSHSGRGLLDEEQRRIRRLEALERAIIAQPPTLIFVWTKNLAQRIEPLVPQDRNIRLVCWKMMTQTAALKRNYARQTRRKPNALMPYSEANFRLRNGTANLSELRSKFSPGWQNASLHSKARK
jgi:hypothetical protein